MTMMPDLLREIIAHFSSEGADLASLLSPVREIIFGLLIVLFLIFEPRGLVGFVDRALGRAENVEARQEH